MITAVEKINKQIPAKKDHLLRFQKKEEDLLDKLFFISFWFHSILTEYIKVLQELRTNKNDAVDIEISKLLIFSSFWQIPKNVKHKPAISAG